MIEEVIRKKKSLALFFQNLGQRVQGKRVVLYSNNPIFTRKVQAFAGLLRKRGFRVEICVEARHGYCDKTKALLASSRDLWLLFSGRVLPVEALPRYFIFYIADPIDRQRQHNWVDDTYFEIMQRAQQVWSYSPCAEEVVRQRGLPFYHVPFGYAPHYESSFRQHIRWKRLDQDIDVLFFGTISGRRKRMLEQLGQRGMNVLAVGPEEGVYGEKLDQLLARSKIVLSMYYSDEVSTHYPDLARVDHLLANRIFVLHEKTPLAGLLPGFEEHVATCAYGEIPERCDFFLKNAEERSLISGAVHEWFRSKYSLDDRIPYQALRSLLHAHG